MERTLAGGEPVGVAGRLDEPGATVLEHETVAGHDHLGAEAVEDALDQRDGHAVPIRRADVGGAADGGVAALVGGGQRLDLVGWLG